LRFYETSLRLESMRKELVSVIMAAYNAERYIGEAIRSVLDQTYSFFELLIVDDGSSDGTLEVVRLFSDDRIRFIRHNENKGVAEFRNTALEKARGKWIALLDADDKWLPERLELLLNVLNNTGEGYFVADVHLVCFDSPEGLKPWNSMLKLFYNALDLNKEILEFSLLDFLKSGSLLIHPIFPATAIKQYNLRYNAKIIFGEDFEFYCNLFRVGLKLKLYTKPLYLYRLTSGSITASKIMIKGSYDVLTSLLQTDGFSEGEKEMFMKLLRREEKESIYREFTYYIKHNKFFDAFSFDIKHPDLFFRFLCRLPRFLRYRISVKKFGAYVK